MELLPYVLTPVLLLGAWVSGTLIERWHLGNLLRLESGSKDILALTIEDVPPDWRIESSDLVIGNVVISLDYFKRFAAGLKGIVGGNIRCTSPCSSGPVARL